MKILRTMGILALVAGLLLGGAGGTFAQEEEPELAEIEGVISDTEADTVTIAPEQGEAVTLTITTTEINKDGEPATIEDLAKDDEVEALYNPETLEAVEIVAQSPEPAETPEPAENGGPAGESRAGGPPDRGPHSPGKRGLFGTVTSVAADVISLETKQGPFDITRVDITKYMVPGETHGPQLLATFLDIVDELEGRRVAVLVTLTSASTADAIKLMLIPSPAHHRHMHRVGVVEVGAFDPDTSITIIDKDGESHTFAVNEYTVYRPSAEDGGISELTGSALIEAIEEGCVTVVTKGDPKLPHPEAKAIVLHDELPDWAP